MSPPAAAPATAPLRVTFVQPDLHWESPTANLAALEELLWQRNEDTDCIVLPEMFTTGFTAHAAVAEVMGLTTFRWMRQQAERADAAVVGSYLVREGKQLFNRLVWMEPDGTFATYDKRHLFRLADEARLLTAGHLPLVRSWRGWHLRFTICYDLRFPVWCRNADNHYDLLLCVANWPAVRRQAWDTLLRARAIENLAYVVGCNRVGSDGQDVVYAGGSVAVDFTGTTLLAAGTDAGVHTVTLDPAALAQHRAAFPAHLDADPFQLL